MYFPLSELTLLFGDGRYSNPDGSYYMHTDAGYMRNFLSIGGATLLLIYVEVLLLLSLARQINWVKYNKLSQFKTAFFLIVFVLFVHLKGDVLLVTRGLHNIIFILYFYYELKHKETQWKQSYFISKGYRVAG
jgi:hypothetical protein